MVRDFQHLSLDLAGMLQYEPLLDAARHISREKHSERTVFQTEHQPLFVGLYSPFFGDQACRVKKRELNTIQPQACAGLRADPANRVLGEPAQHRDLPDLAGDASHSDNAFNVHGIEDRRTTAHVIQVHHIQC